MHSQCICSSLPSLSCLACLLCLTHPPSPFPCLVHSLCSPPPFPRSEAVKCQQPCSRIAALQDPNALLSIQHLIQHTTGAGVGRAPEDPGPDTVGGPRRSVLAFIAADNADEDTSDDSQAGEQAEALMGLALAPEEAIDWDAPLTANRAPAEPTGTPLPPHTHLPILPNTTHSSQIRC